MLPHLSLICTFAAVTHPFALTIDSSSPTVAAGDEVRIHVVVTNVSDYGLRISRRSLNQACAFRIEVSGPNGLSKDEPPCFGSSLSFTPLEPGEKTEGSIVLTEIYQDAAPGGEDLVNVARPFAFTPPGVYFVQLSRIDLDDPDHGYVTSNILKITILQNGNATTLTTAPSLSLKISATDDRLEVGQPILIHVSLTNISNRPITVPWSAAPQHAAEPFAVASRSDRGEMIKASGSDGRNKRSLEPGESLEQDCVLKGEPLDFTAPGTYEVQLFGIDRGNGNDWSLRSNKITITVFQ